MLGSSLKCGALGLILLSIGAVFAPAASPGSAGQPAAAAAPFDRFKNLAGDWVAAEDGEMLEFVGSNELRTVWTEIEAGKPVFVAKSRLVRKPR
ncbi:MAG TPA: hypothetical protein VGA31_10470 [Thermoanaerobaculia bacterium]